jgi:hypothetical protein
VGHAYYDTVEPKLRECRDLHAGRPAERPESAWAERRQAVVLAGAAVVSGPRTCTAPPAPAINAGHGFCGTGSPTGAPRSTKS